MAGQLLEGHFAPREAGRGAVVARPELVPAALVVAPPPEQGGVGLAGADRFPGSGRPLIKSTVAACTR